MKGHAKIELTNVKTGEVQVIEDDNIVTNLLRDMYQMKCLQIRDTFAHTIDATLTNYDSENNNRSHTPYTEYGGLIMFKEQLEADPDKYYPEEQATMVAHASDDTYSGVDLTRGSFNSNLSSYNINEGKVTLVWDFNMEQGNGTIGTVCLCNHVDGKIGYGSKYTAENTNNAKAPFYHHSNRQTYPNRALACVSHTHNFPVDSAYTYLGIAPIVTPVYLDYENNRLIFMYLGLLDSEYVFFSADIDASSVNPLTVKAYGSAEYTTDGFQRDYLNNVISHTVPVNRVVKSAYSAASYPHGSNRCNPSISKTKTMAGLDFKGNFWYSNEVVINDGYAGEYSDNIGASYPKTDYAWCWRNNTEKVFNKLDLSTMEVTEYKVTNATGHDICRNGGYVSSYCFLSDLCVIDNYMFIRDNTRLLAINLENNSDVHEVTWEDGTPVSLYASSYEDKPGVFCNEQRSSNDYLYNYGWAVNVFGNALIFNVSGGFYPVENSWTDSYMCIVRTTDFVAQKLSAVRKAGFSITNSSGDRNRGSTVAVPVGHNLVMSPGQSNGSNWTTTSKYVAGYAGIFHAYNPMGLITINTLAEPVTKTADMTMRITYTLTT